MRSLHITKPMRRWVIVSLMISTTYFALIGGMPNITPFAPHDDILFQKLAFKIANGDWLGQRYDSQVLAKGAFHSIQMALAYKLGIPVGLWFHILYLVAAWFFCTLALPDISICLRSLCYLSFLFDPWQFTSFGIRLLREETYIPFLLFAITFFIYALDHIKREGQDSERLIHANRLISLSLLLSGLSFGLLLITREARIFVYLLIAFASILFAIKYVYFHGLGKKSIFKLFSFVVAFILLAPIPLFLTSLQNQSAYGLFLSNEFEDGQFKKFYQDLISIKIVDQKDKPWVPVQIQTLNKLQKATEGKALSSVLLDLDQGWKKFGCEQHSEACGEYGGGWLMWALRDAMFMQTGVTNPKSFQSLAHQMRYNIKFICQNQSQDFDCSSRAFGYLPHPSRWGHDHSNYSLISREFIRKVKGAFLPSLISYPPALFDDSAPQSKWTSRIGVYTIHSTDEQSRWNRRVRSLFRLSEIIRFTLLAACVSLLVLNLCHLKKIIEDPSIFFTSFALALQIIILSLIELTSFHAGGYLILASPILTILLCRMIMTLHASRFESL